MTRGLRRGAFALVALVAAAGMLACDGDGDGVIGPPPPAPLTTEAKAALYDALQDAYRTYYTYDAVLDDLGSVAPFSTIVAIEQSYTTTLATLYTTNKLTPPAAVWNAGNVPRFQNLQQACMAAEESEVATQLMFERLLRLNLPADVRQAFEALRTTARTTHRLQFRDCIGGTITPLTAVVETSVIEALQDEYERFFTYNRVLIDFGDVAPFFNVHDAEWLHIGAAANLLVKRDLTLPASLWTNDNVDRFATVQAACSAALEEEIENVLMYDRLLLQSLPTDVERVFENLREASLEHHLPAFQQCAGGGTAPVGADVLAAMEEAIQDEYRAWYTYAAAVDDLEPDYPFSVIRDAEESHYTAVATLFQKRSLAVPTSTWNVGNVTRFATLVSACDAAVVLETNTVAMYDRLLGLTLPDDIKRVFQNLRDASLMRHIPAFEACGN